MPFDTRLLLGNVGSMSRSRRATAPELLQARLDELGWNQTKLAEVLGVHISQVSRWLSGQRAPSLDLAFRIERSKVALPAEAWVDAPPVSTNAA